MAHPRVFASHRVAEAWARLHYSSWFLSLSAAEVAAVAAYKGGAYRPVNQVLRGQSGDPLDAQVLAAIGPDLDAAFGRGVTPEDVLVYRHVRVNDPVVAQLPLFRVDEASLARLTGQFVRDKGYLSASLRPDDAYARHSAIGGGLVLEIVAPRGTWGGLTELVARRGAELELTLCRGSTYRILGARTDPAGRLTLELEVAGQP